MLPAWHVMSIWSQAALGSVTASSSPSIGGWAARVRHVAGECSQAVASDGRRPSTMSALARRSSACGGSAMAIAGQVRHADEPRRPGVNARTSPSDGSQVIGPSPRPGSERRICEGRAIEVEHRSGVVLLGLDREARPSRRLRQPRLGAGACRAEPERRLGARPGQRHAAAVATRVGPARPEVHRVLEAVDREVVDLVEAELVALVDVERARAGRPTGARRLGPGGGRDARSVGVPCRFVANAKRRVFPAEAGDRPGHVVVGQDPGRRRADGRMRGERRCRSTRAGWRRPTAGRGSRS